MGKMIAVPDRASAEQHAPATAGEQSGFKPILSW
jgi:hypothetical protein